MGVAVLLADSDLDDDRVKRGWRSWVYFHYLFRVESSFYIYLRLLLSAYETS